MKEAERVLHWSRDFANVQHFEAYERNTAKRQLIRVFALGTMGIREECRCTSLGLGYDYPHHFIKSQWNISQPLFITWRAFWFLWHLGWLIRSIQLEVSKEDYTGEGLKWFIYLTNWGYAFLFFQSGIHLLVVAYYSCKRKTDSEDFNNERAGWEMKVLWFFTNVSFDAAIIVTVLYWALVFKKLDYALSVMTHAVNSLYVILDIFLIASPVRLLHFVYSCGFAVVYLAFSVFYHLGDGTNSDSDPYIYSSLDWSDTGPTAGLAVGVVLVAVPLVHVFQFALYTLRLYMAETCCPSGKKGGSRDVEDGREGRAGRDRDIEIATNSNPKY